MQLQLVFDSRKKIECQFIALVVRNESLAKRYPGGRKGFLERYSAISNPDLTVYSWAGNDFDDVISDLESDGFILNRDFAVVDVFDHEWSLMLRPEKRKVPHKVSLKAPWIAGRYMDGSIYVWAISPRTEGLRFQPVVHGGSRALASGQKIRP